jgi:hypothetical protein
MVNTILKLRSTLCISLGIAGALTIFTNVSAQPLKIGSGDPGLKIASSQDDDSEFMIYQDEPWTAGISGYIGGMAHRKINVIFEHGYDLNKILTGVHVPAVKQLFPFDTNSAFTSGRGANPQDPRWSIGYRLVDGALTVFTNVQKAALVKYRLADDEVFLGFVDGRIFFCNKGLQPKAVFWRGESDQKVFSYGLPRGVVNIFGVTTGVEQDVGVAVLRKARPLYAGDYEPDFIEIRLSKGKLAQIKMKK